MAEDQPLVKKRAEVLFDVLREQDRNDSKNLNSGSINNDNLQVNQNFEQAENEANSENSSGNTLKAANDGVNMIQMNYISKHKELLQEIDNPSSVEKLCAGLQKENSLSIRCQSALSLAIFCRSQLSKEDCDLLFKALQIVTEQDPFYAFSFCQALLLYVLTKQNLTIDQIEALEKYVLKVAYSIIDSEEVLENDIVQARVILSGEDCYLTASKLCEEMFSGENLDVKTLNVTSLCCSSLRNLSKLTTFISGQCTFSDATLKYILSIIGISTQEIISENLIQTENEKEVISISSYVVHQCLQVLERILLIDPNSPCKTLEHEEFSLFRCLTKLLEWSLLAIFPHETTENNLVKEKNSLQTFHHTTLVYILKVFSILSLNAGQYETYTNMKGTMEKIMICVLNTYFESQDNHFDVLCLALELMINFAIKSRKTFVLLCLKKFHINSQEKVLGIEALLKILDNNLENINELRIRSTKRNTENNSQPTSNAPECDDTTSSEDQDMDLVLKTADEDMELSTLVSFIGVLLMLFIDKKKSFLGFVREKLPLEKCVETVAVIRKVLQFAFLTGGMPPPGMLLLRLAIRKMEQLHIYDEST